MLISGVSENMGTGAFRGILYILFSGNKGSPD